MRFTHMYSMFSVVVVTLLATAAAFCTSINDCLSTKLWHLPGPNPIVSPWDPLGKPAWMSFECEVAGGVQQINATHFVFIYHCLNDAGYQVGMSTATSPLGPWSKPPLEPLLGNTHGSWDGTTVACFNIMPDPAMPGHWLGFYAASGEPKYPAPIGLGIARAASPLGPWKKWGKNPVLSGGKTTDHKHCWNGDQRCSGLYIGSVLYGPHTNYTYWVYMAAPVNSNDEGPLALWTALDPEGPYTFVRYVLDGALREGHSMTESMSKSCEEQCIEEGHCCQGVVSSYNHPSCANGCAMAAAGAPTLKKCNEACQEAEKADCMYDYGNITLNMCQDCPDGCDASDGVSECLEGCRIAFGGPAPPPPLPCGRGGPCWDSGRYSESKVVYHNGMFQLFATASAVGGNASQANKIVEQVGWAFSKDGLHFTEYASNPIGPRRGPSPLSWGTTPMTSAMAEGHAFINGSTIFLFHTIRWSGDGKFAPDGRNGEDLAVEIFVASPTFTVEMPTITPNWDLSLAPGERSPCLYDRKKYRYCANLKVLMRSSGTTAVIKPSISFRVEAEVTGNGELVSASVVISAFLNAAEVGDVLLKLPLKGNVQDGRYVGTTTAITVDDLPDHESGGATGYDFVVSSIANAKGSVHLARITQTAIYTNDGRTHDSLVL